MGTNSGGSYVRWANGFMICYTKLSMADFTYQNYKGHTGYWNFPQGFTSNPIVVATTNEWTTSDSSVKVYDGSIYYCNVMYFVRNPYSKDYTNYNSGNINLVAIGKWK